MTRLTPSVLLVLIAFGTSATAETLDWSRVAALEGEGSQALPVDLPLLAGASGTRPVRAGRIEAVRARRELDRLRFRDGAGREVPYLLVNAPTGEREWLAGEVLGVAETEKTSGFELDTGRLATVDRVRLEGIPAPFLKRFQLEGSGDRTHWTLLQSEGTLFDLPDEELARTEVGFRPGAYRYLRITWDDTNSGRVPPPTRASVRTYPPSAPPPPQRELVPFTQRPSEPGRSRYRIQLPAPGLPIAALRLECGGGHLHREAVVTEARLTGSEVVPVELGRATLRRAMRGDLSAEALRIPLQAPTSAELDLVVDDGDNPELSLLRVAVELEPLPWIYFEVTEKTPKVTAFFVSDEGAPRYDLEAMRGSLDRVSTRAAVWQEVSAQPRSAASAMAEWAPALGAALDVEPFLYTRDVPARPADVQPDTIEAIELDAAVLAHARSDLGDVRLADPQEQQVPYLLERLGEPLSLELGSPRPRPQEDRRVSRYELPLPFEGLPPGRLVLTTDARIFERSVRILAESEPASRRAEPEVRHLASATWRHTVPEVPPPALTLSLPALHHPRLLVEVDEGDNQPLPLLQARLLLPAHRIRFFRPDSGPLTLLYGAPRLGPPRYDLELLAPRLVGVRTVDLQPGAERKRPAAEESLVTERRFFWGALIVAVVVLLGLMAVLLRKEG